MSRIKFKYLCARFSTCLDVTRQNTFLFPQKFKSAQMGYRDKVSKINDTPHKSFAKTRYFSEL